MGCLVVEMGDAATQSQNEMEGRIIAHIIILKSLGILQLLSAEDQSLLLGRDALLLGNLGLDLFDALSLLNFDGDCFAREGLDEELHSPPDGED